MPLSHRSWACLPRADRAPARGGGEADVERAACREACGVGAWALGSHRAAPLEIQRHSARTRRVRASRGFAGGDGRAGRPEASRRADGRARARGACASSTGPPAVATPTGLDPRARPATVSRQRAVGAGTSCRRVRHCAAMRHDTRRCCRDPALPAYTWSPPWRRTSDPRWTASCRLEGSRAFTWRTLSRNKRVNRAALR